MCEIDWVLRLAWFIGHQLPEFLFLLTLEGKNKNIKLSTYRSNPHSTIQQHMALGQEAAEPVLITREYSGKQGAPEAPCPPLGEGFLSMQNTCWDPSQINWCSPSETSTVVSS